MRPVYIWQYPEWPHFTWNESEIQAPLASVRYKQGQLVGMMKVLGLEVQNDSSLEMITMDIVKSCEIEGVVLDSQRVRSSVVCCYTSV